MNLDLDTSWIEKEEKLFSVESNYIQSPMNSINCYFIYIGSDLSIQKIIKEEEVLTLLNMNDYGISNERILQIIQSKRFLNNGIKYKMISLLKYHVDLSPDKIRDYCYNDIPSDFFKEISFLNNIVIESSIFIFHSINSLYFLFKQDDSFIKPMRSILKTESSLKSTKKVRIMDGFSDLQQNGKRRHTRKCVV